jgi:hypothetical protein
MSVDLIGCYYRDADATGPKNTLACGWPNLKIGRILAGKPAPYRIDDSHGAIDWAPESSISSNGRSIVVGIFVVAA